MSVGRAAQPLAATGCRRISTYAEHIADVGAHVGAVALEGGHLCRRARAHVFSVRAARQLQDVLELSRKGKMGVWANLGASAWARPRGCVPPRCGLPHLPRVVRALHHKKGRFDVRQRVLRENAAPWLLAVGCGHGQEEAGGTGGRVRPWPRQAVAASGSAQHSGARAQGHDAMAAFALSRRAPAMQASLTPKLEFMIWNMF